MMQRSSRLLGNRLIFAGAENASFLAASGLCPFRQDVRGKVTKPKPYIVPIELLKPSEPVSGSKALGDMSKVRKFEWEAESLNARGFLRFQKEYKPPKDAKDKVISISKSMVPQLGKTGDDELMQFQLSDSRLKFELLAKIFDEFKYSIPNSMLYMINKIEDVVNFYATPVKTSTPFDGLVRQQDELPPNLHVQKEPIRFHPETDTMFGGVTAFPKSSTIVTGLRAKKKYKGYEYKDPWLKL